MPDTSLNELNRTIGGLVVAVEGMHRDVQEDRRISAEYRQSVRDELGKIVMRQTHLESDMSSVKSKVEAHEKVTVEVTTLRTKAAGAGTLGRWLLRIGIGVVSVAGWLIGVYTYLTGRPPP